MRKRAKISRKNVFQIIKFYGIKSVFYRYFASSLLISFLVLGPFAAVAGFYYFNRVHGEMAAEAVSSTVKSKDIIDTVTTEFFKDYEIAVSSTAVSRFLDAKAVGKTGGYELANDVYTDYIMPLIKSSDSIKDIFIYSFRSNFVVSSRMQKTVLQDLKPEWLKTARATGKNFMIFPRKRENSSDYDLLYTYQVIYDRGELAGLFVTEMAYSEFAKLVESAFPEDPEKLYLVNDAGLVLYSSEPDRTNTSIFMSGDMPPEMDLDQLNVKMSVDYKNYVVSMVGSRDSKTFILSFSQKDNWKQLLWNNLFVIACFGGGIILASVLIAVFSAYRHYHSIVGVLNCLEGDGGETELSETFGELYHITDSILKISHNSQVARDELTEKTEVLRSTQIAALQTQINPHFIFNTLQLINLNIIKEVRGDNLSTKLIKDFSELLRFTYDTETYRIPLEEEVDITRKYLQIQEVCYSSRLRVSYDIPEECRKVPVVKLILQPLAENAIVHGFTGKSGVWNLLIAAERQGDRLTLTVKDDGHGMTPEARREILDAMEKMRIRKKNRIGIVNVFQRLKLVYGDSAKISIDSEEGKGTAIRLQFPTGNQGRENEK